MGNEGRLAALDTMFDGKVDEDGVALTPAMIKLVRELKSIIKEQNAKIEAMQQALVEKKNPAREMNAEYYLDQLCFMLKRMCDPNKEYLAKLEWQLERVRTYGMAINSYEIDRAFRLWNSIGGATGHYQLYDYWSELANALEINLSR